MTAYVKGERISLSRFKCPHCRNDAIPRWEGVATNRWNNIICGRCGKHADVAPWVHAWMWTAFPCGFLIGGTLIALKYWQSPALGGVLAMALMFILAAPALVDPLRTMFPDRREEWLVTLKRRFPR